MKTTAKQGQSRKGQDNLKFFWYIFCLYAFNPCAHAGFLNNPGRESKVQTSASGIRKGRETMILLVIWIITGAVGGMLLGNQLRRDTGYVTGMELFLLFVFSLLGPLALGTTLFMEFTDRYGDRRFFEKKKQK